MRIAQISPIIERVPPLKYGGTERVVYELTEGLVKKGHQVTLFASGDSLTSAKLISVYPKPLRGAGFEDLYGSNIYSMMNVGLAYNLQTDFDIIHDHNGYLSLPTANISKTPVAMTYHGHFSSEVVKIFQTLNTPYIVSISEAQTQNITGVNLIGNVYNGLSMEDYPFSSEHGDYLLYVGRLSKEKGVHHAIKVAQILKRQLIIAAKLDSNDKRYFKECIEPELSDDIRWIGEVDVKERNDLMSKAFCFLHPVIFDEPFGLTLIEAMACGCPVIAFNKGSIPEIIENEKTGYVVAGVTEMIQAVKKIDLIDRANCRVHALSKFNAKNMVDNYEKIYEKIINKQHEQR